MRTRLVSDHAATVDRLRLEPDLPEPEPLAAQLDSSLAALPGDLDFQIIEEIRRQDRRPSRIGRLFLWLVLLWFPFAQPVLEGLLEMFAAEGAIRIAHGAYRVVAAMSAVHLLAGFGVVAAVYLVLLAAMYARALKTIQRYRGRDDEGTPVEDAVTDVLIRDLLTPLGKPLLERLARLKRLADELDRLAGAAEGNPASPNPARPLDAPPPQTALTSETADV